MCQEFCPQGGLPGRRPPKKGGTPPEGGTPPARIPPGKETPLPSRPPPLPRRPPRRPLSRPTLRGEIEGIRSWPTAKGEIEGDQIQAHTQGPNWGGSHPGPHPRAKLRGITSRPTPKGEIEGDHIQAHTQEGNWGGSGLDPPPMMTTAVGGMHPTGTHSCFWLTFTGPGGHGPLAPPGSATGWRFKRRL